MQIAGVDRIYAHMTVTATLFDGTAAAVTGIQAAVLRRGTAPSAATPWTSATLVNGRWRVLLAGPYADPAGAIVVPATGGDLWARVTDNPEVQTVKVENVDVIA